MRAVAMCRIMQITLGSIVISSMVLLNTENAVAQRRPIADETLGDERSIVIPDANNSTIDRIEGGAERGDNLFHSFQEFHVDEGRGVYFDDRGFANIISRVTGGVRSEILGVLGVIGDANLFLINPSGIIFGEGAQLDVNGSFVASTADSFVFENGFAFSATNPQSPPLLTVSVPIGLQYRTQTPGEIAVSQSELLVGDGQSLILAGGNVTIDGSYLAPELPEGGRIELGGVAGAGTVGLSANGNLLSLSFPDMLAWADVLLTSGSVLEAYAENRGSIAINARNIDILDRSVLRAGISSELGTINSQAGDITLDSTGILNINNSGVLNDVRLRAVGDAGNITIEAGSVILEDRSIISSSTYGNGDAGTITIDARDQVSLSDSSIFSFGDQGDAGSIIINARDQVSLNDSSIFSNGGVFNQIRGQDGDNGEIRVTTGSFSLVRDSSLSTSTFAFSGAGNITIDARNQVSLSDSSISSNGSQGDAGTITVDARDRVSLNHSSISSGGGFDQERGQGGEIRISTGSFSLVRDSSLSTSTFAFGSAGNIIIDARNQVSLNDSSISSDGDQGNAGTITIDARDQVSLNDSSISSNGGVFNQTRGQGGEIRISTGLLSMIDTSSLSSNSLGQGDAGNIVVGANEIEMVSSSIEANTTSQTGGNITLQEVELFLMRRGSQISTEAGINRSQGGGNGGNIFINADLIVAFPDEDSNIKADAFDGRGGNVEITTQGLFGIQPQDEPTELSDHHCQFRVRSARNYKRQYP